MQQINMIIRVDISKCSGHKSLKHVAYLEALYEVLLFYHYQLYIPIFIQLFNQNSIKLVSIEQ